MCSTRRLVALFVFILIAHRLASVWAGTFSDSFPTNPFAAPARWCERYHHVHWDSINLLVSGNNQFSCSGYGSGLSCTTTTPPCTTCTEAWQDPPSVCSAAPGYGNFLITTANYTGLTRSAQTVFAIQRHLLPTLNEHVTTYAVAHPNCHAGFQAFVFPQSGGGYKLQVASTNEKFPCLSCDECGVTPTDWSLTSATFSLTPTTLPRYKLTLTLTQDRYLSWLVMADAALVDTQTGATLATIHRGFSKHAWYNNQAKRFGVGSVFAVPTPPAPTPAGTMTVPHDNFVGTFQ